MKSFWQRLDEMSPPGFASSIRAAFLHHPDLFGTPDSPGKLNAYAIFWNMAKNGAKSSYTGTKSSLKGKPKKKKKARKSKRRGKE